ncbi:hypothetical protein B2J95_06195 [Enterobacter cloacae]|uniref:Uncharacterized protein n=1 Tax=Enterobacter bugandensis TaxID=881260 RepID=A0ABX4VJF0_9ENTR|nr:hypothetical protein B2J95_06195 [Enterobacter cloacae]PNF44558.1 hypothetical protein C1166_01280 [Enterobacter bugandensis]PNF54037.1 hypothetical protein C1169_05730 [Enterobacter bugandensis]PNF62824.1 hypothetical protein C1168_05730 [Enterobacter bugandensis]PNF67463.1 hypothetical protein C1167_05730 [Enterobacter bugandensis]
MAFKGIPYRPLSRGLFPRHLRATFASFFVHLPNRGQTTLPQGRKGINSVKKIVQVCALLCDREKRPRRKECRQI